MKSQFRPGERCGDYELLAWIGQGGMAEVWSARSLSSGQTVAVKTLLPAYADNSVLKERLAREGQSQNFLQHPNILRSQGTFHWNGAVFMVMDLVDGESLEKYLQRRRIMPVPEVRGVAQAVLSALGHAHEHNIVHRDVKPSNILLSRKGKILLGDFGIALLQNSIRLTRYGGMGTPSYMSPEQIVGREIDHRSDIYSVGCVLYELLTGAPPFHATGPDSNEIVRRAHQQTPPPPLIPRNPEVPAALEKAVLRALEKLPGNRFESCASFAAALGVSLQVRTAEAAAGQPAVIFPRGTNSPASPVSMPRVGTPASSTSDSSAPSHPQGPISGPGVTTMKAGDATPPHSTLGRLVPEIVERRAGFTGILAIAAALALAALALSRWGGGWGGSTPSAPTAPVSAPPASITPAPEAPPPAGQSAPSAKSHAPAASNADADQPAGRDSINPSAALDQLNRAVEGLRPDSPSGAAASGGNSANRPPPLAPPPGSLARTSGVLQWTGSRGDEVEILGSTVTGGVLSGDALPGVPVRVWIENDNGTIVQLPSEADGYRKLTLRSGGSRMRIHWKTLSTGQSR